MKKFLAALIVLCYVTSVFAAVTVNVNGSNYTIPQTGEKGWGANVTTWIQAISQNTLQPSGGTFTLTADIDFGANYGLKSAYYKSRSSNIGSVGVLRLANDEGIGWRNAANSANLLLKANSSNQLEFNGGVIPLETSAVFDDSGFIIEDNADGSKELDFSLGGATASTKSTLIFSQTANRSITFPDATTTLVGTDSTQTLTSKTIDGDSNTLQDIGITSLKTEAGDANKVILRDGSGVIGSALVSNSNVDASAAITRSKLASGTASHVIINDGSGVLSSESSLAISRGGTGQSTQTSGFDALSPTTTKGDLIVSNGSDNIRLAVGSNGTVLKANSSQASGLEWASPAANLAVRSVTSTDTATTADDVLLLSGASFTQTIFTAAGNTGKVLTIIHSGISLTQVYTLATTSGQTIGGIASGSYAMYTNGEMLRLISDGANWLILDHKTETEWVDGGAVGLSASAAYVFTVTAANATLGAVYSNNGFFYTVRSTITGTTTLTCAGTGAPASSGTLTKVSGTGDATITFSSRTTTGQPVKGTVTTDKLWWKRRGSEMMLRLEYLQSGTGTAGSGDYFYEPVGVASGVRIDIAKIRPHTLNGDMRSIGAIRGSVFVGNGSNVGVGIVMPYSPIHYKLGTTTNASGSVLQIGSGFYPVSDASLAWAADFALPILGWQP